MLTDSVGHGMIEELLALAHVSHDAAAARRWLEDALMGARGAVDARLAATGATPASKPAPVTAHPYGQRGKQLREILGKKGYPLGQEIMQKATEGTIKEVTYWWPRPGSDKPLEKTTFYTRAGDQICGVAIKWAITRNDRSTLSYSPTDVG
jgi:hypothetical protein